MAKKPPKKTLTGIGKKQPLSKLGKSTGVSKNKKKRY